MTRLSAMLRSGSTRDYWGVFEGARATLTSRVAIILFILAPSLPESAGAQAVSQASPAAPPSIVRLADELADLLRASSEFYDLSGIRVQAQPSPLERDGLRSTADPDFAELKPLFDRYRALRDRCEEIAASKRAQQASSVNAFGLDVLARGIDAFLNGDDGPPIEIIGDAYVREDEIVSVALEDVSSRQACRVACNTLAAAIRDYATKTRGAGRSGGIAIEFVTAGKNKGFLTIANRGSKALEECIVIVHSVPDKQRVGQTQAVGDFANLARLAGRSEQSINDRKRLNASTLEYLGTDHTRIVYVPELEAGKSVEIQPCDSPQALRLAAACDVSIWTTDHAIVDRPVKGLAEIQALMWKPRPTSGPVQVGGNRSEAAAYASGGAIATAEKLALTDPCGALSLLLEARNAGNGTTDPAFGTAFNSIVAKVQQLQRDVAKQVGGASVRVQEANGRLAKDPSNKGLREQYEQAKKELGLRKEEAARIRTLLALR